ncbi:MAG: thiol:disulfide interchange protein DsbA/DsbL [Betaproteobacteria bacterium]|nr:thiol:disulfide interchange protein DsbA/DsbL [Betaproteobacteria bacterium]
MVKRVLFVLALAFAAAGPAAHAQTFQEGVDYMVIKQPIQTDNPARVEVVEFFWYGCPHCYEFDPSLESWVKALPKDVEFKRIPAPLNRVWETAARVYYTLESMGLVEKLHTPLFNAIHQDRLRITNERALLEWLDSKGVDTKKFSAAYRSFSVESKLKRAQQISQAAALEGVPALMVNGKYLVPGQSAARMLAITDSLIAQSRKEMAKK